jgi:menaquinone-dependent protoporphyrinogen oxidase
MREVADARDRLGMDDGLMKILVTAASRHGSTLEIAQAIAEILITSGAETVVGEPDAVGSITEYDAVVLGSGVYAGSWLEPAIHFAARRSEALRAMPVWLFSSGPVGTPPRPPSEECVKLDRCVVEIGARDHCVFAGRLDRRVLGFIERALVTAFHATEGDFRDWAEIASWAGRVARELELPAVAAPAR